MQEPGPGHTAASCDSMEGGEPRREDAERDKELRLRNVRQEVGLYDTTNSTTFVRADRRPVSAERWHRICQAAVGLIDKCPSRGG